MGTGSFSPSASGNGGANGKSFFKALGGGSSASKKEREVDSDISKIFKIMSQKSNFLDLLSSPAIRHAYSAIFTLSGEVFLNHSWNGIEKNYGVGTGPGCLRKWVTAVLDQPDISSSGFRNTAKVLLDTFMVQALGNKVEVYLSGDATAVMGALKKNIFNSTSAHFLKILLKDSLRSQVKGVNLPDEKIILKACEGLANKVVDDFKKSYHGKPYSQDGIQQISHEDLFTVIGKEQKWFMKEITE